MLVFRAYTRKMNNGSSSHGAHNIVCNVELFPRELLFYSSVFAFWFCCSSTILILGSFDCKCFIYNTTIKRAHKTHKYRAIFIILFSVSLPHSHNSCIYLCACVCRRSVCSLFIHSFFPSEILYQILCVRSVYVNFNAISTCIKINA